MDRQHRPGLMLKNAVPELMAARSELRGTSDKIEVLVDERFITVSDVERVSSALSRIGSVSVVPFRSVGAVDPSLDPTFIMLFVAQLIQAAPSGIFSNALYDALKVFVLGARRRGKSSATVRISIHDGRNRVEATITSSDLKALRQAVKALPGILMASKDVRTFSFDSNLRTWVPTEALPRPRVKRTKQQ